MPSIFSYQHRVDLEVPIEDIAGAVKELIQPRQGQALRPVGGRRADDPPGARRAAGRRSAERILAVLREPEETSSRRWKSLESALFRSARWARGS